MSTQNHLARSRSVTISSAYAARTMLGGASSTCHVGSESGNVGVAEGDVHDAGLGVEVEAVLAALAAEPARLHATERRSQVADVVRVEPHHAGLDAMGDAVAATQVVGPDVGGEAVAGVVGQPNGLVFVVERRDAHDGAEDLLLEDAHVGPHVGEHRGGEVVARLAGGRARAAGRPAGRLRATPLSTYDITLA